MPTKASRGYKEVRERNIHRIRENTNDDDDDDDDGGGHEDSNNILNVNQFAFVYVSRQLKNESLKLYKLAGSVFFTVSHTKRRFFAVFK